MELAARTQYLKDIKDLTIRCQSKLESLVTSVGWSVDSLNRNFTETSCSNETETHGSVSTPDTQEGNPQLEDFEKRYNDLLSGLPTHEKKGQEKSEAEALAELLEFERDAKRRRISYKNKVHTKNKSHTEVLRELVREQMEVLKQISGGVAKEVNALDNPIANEEDTVGLIQLSFTKGNPHTVWQKIGQMVESRDSSYDKRLLSRADDGSRDNRSRQFSRERSSKPYNRDDRSSWRCHDDRDDRHVKHKRMNKSYRSYSKNNNRDYSRHSYYTSEKRRSCSPEN